MQTVLLAQDTAAVTPGAVESSRVGPVHADPFHTHASPFRFTVTQVEPLHDRSHSVCVGSRGCGAGACHAPDEYGIALPAMSIAMHVVAVPQETSNGTLTESKLCGVNHDPLYCIELPSWSTALQNVVVGHEMPCR